jgi:Leucine-rich repeat (LRR) protein
LILDGNAMGTLPNFLRAMTTLTHLSLKYCNFTRLPYWLGDLGDLSRLDLLGNDISSPPEEIQRRGVEAMVRVPAPLTPRRRGRRTCGATRE